MYCRIGTSMVTEHQRFCPIQFKRCARPAETHEWIQQESHVTRAVVTSVLEPISNRSTGSSPINFLLDGDPATSVDEVCGLFRFGGAVLFELEWLVSLLMLTSLFPSLALKTFSASSNKHIMGAFTTELVGFVFSLNTLKARSIKWFFNFWSRGRNFCEWFMETSFSSLLRSWLILTGTHKLVCLSLVAEPVIKIENGWLSPTSLYRVKRPPLFHIRTQFWSSFISTCCMGTDFVELKPFTRISSFCPIKFKRCASPAETHERIKQESHVTRAMFTSVLEPISNRSTARSPVSFLWEGDPATFDD